VYVSGYVSRKFSAYVKSRDYLRPIHSDVVIAAPAAYGVFRYPPGNGRLLDKFSILCQTTAIVRMADIESYVSFRLKFL
jgi:hypothetical protein